MVFLLLWHAWTSCGLLCVQSFKGRLTKTWRRSRARQRRCYHCKSCCDCYISLPFGWLSHSWLQAVRKDLQELFGVSLKSHKAEIFQLVGEQCRQHADVRSEKNLMQELLEDDSLSRCRCAQLVVVRVPPVTVCACASLSWLQRTLGTLAPTHIPTIILGMPTWGPSPFPSALNVGIVLKWLDYGSLCDPRSKFFKGGLYLYRVHIIGAFLNHI